MLIPLRFGDRELTANAGESVLEAVERAGERLLASCRAGACQSCLVRATDGVPPPDAQTGLKESQRRQGMFLACLCRPTAPLSFVCANDADFIGSATVESVSPLGADVARITLKQPAGFSFRAGQFVTLTRPDGLSRSYSIATLPDLSETFAVHVRRIPGGRMSTWFCDESPAGTRLRVDGPKGECFYASDDITAPLTLVGTGTGIAPVAAIVEDALLHGHRGPIVLYQGATTEDRFYDVERLRALARNHPNVRYVRCVLAGTPFDEEVKLARLDDLVIKELTSPKRQRAYLCGDPALVNSLRKKLFLSGVSLKQIFADAFVMAAKTS